MINRTKGIRTLAVLLLLVTLIGAISRASAQEASDDIGSTEVASTSVSVDCSFDGEAGSSACSFVPTDATATVTSLSIPDSVFCSTILSTSASVVDGVLYQDLSGDGISVVVSGNVAAGGGATYTVGLNGLPSDVAGAGLTCDSAVDQPDESIDEPTQEPDVTEPTETTPEASPEPGITPETTPEDVNTSESTPEAGEIDNGGVPAETQDEPIPDVTVSVLVYDCTSDPGSTTPASYGDCVVVEGVSVAGAADSTDLGSVVTDGSGYASFSAPDGSAVTLTEDVSTVPDGFQPIGGAAAYLTASEGATVTYVNLLETVAGRLQIVNGSCPTSGTARTEFRVIEPRTVSPASTAPACAATGGTVFGIYGGSLGPDGISVITGPDGSWRGYLPAGDYNVVDDSGASADVTVVGNDISLVIVVDYVAAPLGVLNVSRFDCADPDHAGVDISFSTKKPTVGSGDDCDSSDGQITIDVQSEVSSSSLTSFMLGADGVAEIELPSGSYVLTDSYTGESASFTLSSGSRLYAVIQDIVIGGDGVGPGDGDGNGNGGGGGDGTGDPDGGSGNGGSGGGTHGGGTGNGSGDGSGEGGGTTTGGSDDGATSGGIDAGTTEDLSSAEEVAGVNSLPLTGVEAPSKNNHWLMIALMSLASLVAFGALTARKRQLQRIRK